MRGGIRFKEKLKRNFLGSPFPLVKKIETGRGLGLKSPGECVRIRREEIYYHPQIKKEMNGTRESLENIERKSSIFGV